MYTLWVTSTEHRINWKHFYPAHCQQFVNVHLLQTEAGCLNLGHPGVLVVKGPAADATGEPQPWGFLCNPVMNTMIIFCPFISNGAPVERNWQGKTEVIGEKPVPAPLCPPQIPYGPTRHRTRASAVGGRRLTAWAMARSSRCVSSVTVTINTAWHTTACVYSAHCTILLQGCAKIYILNWHKPGVEWCGVQNKYTLWCVRPCFLL
jgi:hypothetical protein